MVKVKCPVCGGTGRVPNNFGGGCQPNPYPWYQPNPYPWYQQPSPVWCTQTNNITVNAASANGVQFWSPSSTTTHYYPCDKTCPACHGSGMQEVDCDCCCNRCSRQRRKCFRRAPDVPCPNPYVPFQGTVSVPTPITTTTPYVPFATSTTTCSQPCGSIGYTITISSSSASPQSSSGEPNHVTKEE